jgi:hypothetical protein
MSTGILHTLKMMADIKALMLDVIQIAKSGVGIGAIKQVLEILSSVKQIISEAPATLPELKDLDSSEAGRLAEASYEMIKDIIRAIVA